MDFFFPKIAPLPIHVAQVNPAAAQKTPWLAHLHPRLTGNVDQEDARVVLALWRCLTRNYGRTAGVRFRQGQDIFLYFTASRPALGPTQPPVW
jgi:hypothetical protein